MQSWQVPAAYGFGGLRMVESRVDPAGESVIEGRVNAEFRREAITLRFRYEGQLIEWSKSTTYETIGGREMPAWVSQRRYGIGGGPDRFVKAALRDGSPELVELSFISKPGQSEVRQKHLRAVD